MLKSILNVVFATLVATLLAACGGGGEGFQVKPTTTKIPEVAKAPSDATLTLVDTTTVVTPGESFRAALLKVSCPTIVEAPDYCKKAVPLGEMGFEISLELQDSKILYNGRQINGYFTHDGTVYRFLPTERVEMWQTGTIELISTLAPTAKTGEESIVVTKAASASYDKALSLESGKAKIEVLALPHYAPASITASPDVIGKGGVLEEAGFNYTCPVTVTMGCNLKEMQMNVYGAVLNSDFSIAINGNVVSQGQVWNDSSMQFGFGISYFVPAGSTIKVRFMGTVNGGLYFYNISSMSGDKAIAPQLAPGCSTINPSGCKG